MIWPWTRPRPAFSGEHKVEFVGDPVDAYVDHVGASRAQRNRWEIYDPDATHYTQDTGAARPIAKAVGWQEDPSSHRRRRLLIAAAIMSFALAATYVAAAVALSAAWLPLVGIGWAINGFLFSRNAYRSRPQRAATERLDPVWEEAFLTSGHVKRIMNGKS